VAASEVTCGCATVNGGTQQCKITVRALPNNNICGREWGNPGCATVNGETHQCKIAVRALPNNNICGCGWTSPAATVSNGALVQDLTTKAGHIFDFFSFYPYYFFEIWLKIDDYLLALHWRFGQFKIIKRYLFIANVFLREKNKLNCIGLT